MIRATASLARRPLELGVPGAERCYRRLSGGLVELTGLAYAVIGHGDGAHGLGVVAGSGQRPHGGMVAPGWRVESRPNQFGSKKVPPV